MTTCILLSVSGCDSSMEKPADGQPTKKKPAYAMAIHGGAGVITRGSMSLEREEGYRQVLSEALDIGETILQEGGSSLEAVVATVMFMEDSPYFNAGKGAVFNHEGKNEMDASVMTGHDLMAGAVGGVRIIKHPVLAAKAVMEQSEHVLLTGLGAEAFAVEQGLETADPAYFFTQQRWDALQRIRSSDPDAVELDHSDRKHGTVGAVALDKSGNLAAATSTGGMTNKKYNRIGDSPIIGAGTYAENATCAISCTGHGEYFIRHAVAYDVAAQMKYAGKDLIEAGDFTVHQTLQKSGGTGGLISIDKDGNIHLPFNTEGMYRGFVKPDERMVKIYRDE